MEWCGRGAWQVMATHAHQQAMVDQLPLNIFADLVPTLQKFDGDKSIVFGVVSKLNKPKRPAIERLELVGFVSARPVPEDTVPKQMH